MNKKFVVRLSVEERGQLESLVAKGKAAARKLTRARILLESRLQSPWPGVVRRANQRRSGPRSDHCPPGPPLIRRRWS